MKEDKGNNISFVFFITAVMALAIIYFSVPERTVFIENQLDWWGEFWDLVKTLGE